MKVTSHYKGISMFGNNKGDIAADEDRLNGKKLKIGIVQARFNSEITNALAQACKLELLALGVAEKDITLVSVPGALEIPLALQAMAEKNHYDALVALGCIIRGETYHFELVANESGTGITRIGLDYQIPIANAVLTTENTAQALARQSEKGRDAARVAVEMVNLLEHIA
jgi:6,7-dimethyl-8-ribityllumazine synthase